MKKTFPSSMILPNGLPDARQAKEIKPQISMLSQMIIAAALIMLLPSSFNFLVNASL